MIGGESIWTVNCFKSCNTTKPNLHRDEMIVINSTKEKKRGDVMR